MTDYEPNGDWKRQREDRTTTDFIAYLKTEKLLKGLLVGHEHITMQDRFSETAMGVLKVPGTAGRVRVIWLMAVDVAIDGAGKGN